MSKQVIASPDAPAAIGPYSQAIAVPAGSRLVFCSGQIALRPDGGFVDGDVRAQTRQAIANLAAVLEAAGAGLQDVVRVTLYLADLGDYAAVNEEYARSFGDSAPARAAVEVAALPRGARVEIACIAAVAD